MINKIVKIIFKLAKFVQLPKKIGKNLADFEVKNFPNPSFPSYVHFRHPFCKYWMQFKNSSVSFTEIISTFMEIIV